MRCKSPENQGPLVLRSLTGGQILLTLRVVLSARRSSCPGKHRGEQNLTFTHPRALPLPPLRELPFLDEPARNFPAAARGLGRDGTGLPELCRQQVLGATFRLRLPDEKRGTVSSENSNMYCEEGKKARNRNGEDREVSLCYSLALKLAPGREG